MLWYHRSIGFVFVVVTGTLERGIGEVPKRKSRERLMVVSRETL